MYRIKYTAVKVFARILLTYKVHQYRATLWSTTSDNYSVLSLIDWIENYEEFNQNLNRKFSFNKKISSILLISMENEYKLA